MVVLVPLCGLVACVSVVGCSAYILFKLARRRVPVLQRCHVGACGRRVSAFHRYALVVAGMGRPSVVLCLVVCVCICCCVPFLRRLCCLAVQVLSVCVFAVPNSPPMGVPASRVFSPFVVAFQLQLQLQLDGSPLIR